ncbi:MAG: tetratricopeptide repeat protein [Selenomonadaceae bacterium]|nr:tetratricopeptide repeat protein [Selenomonadaceae bacterium]
MRCSRAAAHAGRRFYQHLQQQADSLQALLRLANTPQDKEKYTSALAQNRIIYQSYQLLQESYAAETPAAAMQLLKQSLALYHQNAASCAALASLCLEQNQTADALRYCDDGIAALPNASEYTEEGKSSIQFILLALKGNGLFLNANYADALQAFNAADALRDKVEVAHVRRHIYTQFLFDYGGLQMIQGEYVKSAQLLDRLITELTAQPPKDAARPAADELQGDAYMLATSYAYRGIDRQAQGKLSEAEADFHQARALAEKLSPAAAANIQTLLDNYAHTMK